MSEEFPRRASGHSPPRGLRGWLAPSRKKPERRRSLAVREIRFALRGREPARRRIAALREICLPFRGRINRPLDNAPHRIA